MADLEEGREAGLGEGTEILSELLKLGTGHGGVLLQLQLRPGLAVDALDAQGSKALLHLPAVSSLELQLQHAQLGGSGEL